MDFTVYFPQTKECFKPFWSGMPSNIVIPYNCKNTCDARVYCLINLVVSPLTALQTIAKKVFVISASIFMALAMSLNFQRGYCDRMSLRAVLILDLALALAFYPLNLMMSCTRLALGIIHPSCAFSICR
ncbi:MAG: hypothetical protein BGO14_05405 [Chlamydiales bacterium 38-26]|nr:hypothetical protein [Chlamydiales bacterium]OJV07910.1 MAG: hypothetical protein BGO14_05405 [Chlamydiales bacterium 38-26]